MYPNRRSYRWPFNSRFDWWVLTLLVLLAVPIMVLHVGLEVWDAVGRGWVRGVGELREAWNEVRRPQ